MLAPGAVHSTPLHITLHHSIHSTLLYSTPIRSGSVCSYVRRRWRHRHLPFIFKIVGLANVLPKRNISDLMSTSGKRNSFYYIGNAICELEYSLHLWLLVEVVQRVLPLSLPALPAGCCCAQSPIHKRSFVRILRTLTVHMCVCCVLEMCIDKALLKFCDSFALISETFTKLFNFCRPPWRSSGLTSSRRTT